MILEIVNFRPLMSVHVIEGIKVVIKLADAQKFVVMDCYFNWNATMAILLVVMDVHQHA